MGPYAIATSSRVEEEKKKQSEKENRMDFYFMFRSFSALQKI